MRLIDAPVPALPCPWCHVTDKLTFYGTWLDQCVRCARCGACGPKVTVVRQSEGRTETAQLAALQLWNKRGDL